MLDDVDGVCGELSAPVAVPGSADESGAPVTDGSGGKSVLHPGTFLSMNTPERLKEMADELRSNGYEVEPEDGYYEGLATRLRGAGYKVTKKGDDTAKGKSEADAAARADNAQRQAPAATGITPNGPDAAAAEQPTPGPDPSAPNQASRSRAASRANQP
jgi:hypothetical protein